MRHLRIGLRWLSAAILALAGCQGPDPSLKPKLHEEYVLPPSEDTRFSSPPAYPKETLDSGTPKKDPNKPPGQQFGGPQGSGFGGGMNRMGGGY